MPVGPFNMPVGPFNMPVGPFNMPVGPFNMPVGPFKMPVGPFNMPVGPFNMPVGPFNMPVGSVVAPVAEFEFDKAIALAPAGERTWEAAVHDGWDIAGFPNGGYVMAIGLAALGASVPQSDPVSATAHFTNVSKPGPVVITTEVVRIGRGHSTVTGQMTQDGNVTTTLLATFGNLSPKTETNKEEGHDLGSPPPLPPVEDCLAPESAAAFAAPPIGQRALIRLLAEMAGFAHGNPSGRAEMGGWTRFADDRPPDLASLTLFADAFPPAVFNSGLPLGWTPTVELTVHFRKRPSPGWLQAWFRTRFVSGGYLEEDGELWDSEGHLVALSRQLAMVPRG